MIHFILPGDTLENIAEKIGLENPVYLKEFHNQHCLKEDFIVDDLIPGKKLVLPDLAKIKAYNDKNDAPFKSPELNPKLRLIQLVLMKNLKLQLKNHPSSMVKLLRINFLISHL